MNIYESIPHLTNMLGHQGRNSIGKLGELLVAQLLKKQGYTVSFCQNRQRRGDLVTIDPDGVIQHRIEVKTARRCKDRKWRFLLWKKGQQDYRDADYVILVAVLKSGDVVLFVIPVDDIDARSQICITSHPRDYAGRWSAYRRSPRNLMEH